MKNILIICHDIPSMTVGATLPIYHMIKNLKNQYDINLISFDSGKYNIDNIKSDLKSINTIKIPTYNNIKDQFSYTFKNMLCKDNLHTHSFFNYYYLQDMNKIIKENIRTNDIDIVITDLPMAFYVKDISIPSIVYAFDAVSAYNYKMYKKANSLTSKMFWYFTYKKMHHYEKIYNKFNSCIVVNNKDKILLEKDLSVPIHVIPNGVDINFFKPSKNQKYNEKLVFLGDMSTPPNNDAVKYFIDEIYPEILKEYPVNLYIVGRNPSNYINELNNNENIIVTGSVDDVRDYLNYGTIFITPMISGTGIKNKILEAMSMNLPVVSTSCGISGINANNKIEYFLAENPTDFKNCVVKLLNNQDLQSQIGNNARLFVLNKYSWNKSSNKIKKIIEDIS